MRIVEVVVRFGFVPVPVCLGCWGRGSAEVEGLAIVAGVVEPELGPDKDDGGELYGVAVEGA
jgi:hypothetical protein